MKALLLAFLFVASSALALPEALRTSDLRWHQWGSGEMTWFGFSIYRATLWVAGNDPATSPSALQLEYHRDIPGDRLVLSSLDEMRRLGAEERQLQRWAVELQRVFPDVKDGDSIVGVHLPGRGADFYFRGKRVGEILDATFARHFFAIWLDPKTRSPELRMALLRLPEKR